MGAPVASFSTLHGADGSATYSANGYTVVGAVNGPVEVSRRDELPEEAAIEVNIRPAAGVGSIRERHLESIIEAALRRIILTANFPRTLIQITLQILGNPQPTPRSYALNPSSFLPALPALLQTSLLSLLSAAIPLDTTLTTASVFSFGSEAMIRLLAPDDPTDFSAATSLHVFAFTRDRALLVAESEGDFHFETWQKAQNLAEEFCCQEKDGESMAIEGDGNAIEFNMQEWLVDAVREKVAAEQRWTR